MKVTGALSASLLGLMLLTISCGRSDESKKEPATPSLSLMSTNTPANTIQTNFSLRSIGSLQFSMPMGWETTVQETSSNRVPAVLIHFGPPKGLDFVVEFTALLSGQNAMNIDTRSACEKAIKPYLASALETKIQVQNLNGPEISGHYFSITDKNLVDRIPPAGEYKYLIQGNAKMSRFATAFKIVSNDPSGDKRNAALEMIRTVRFIPR